MRELIVCETKIAVYGDYDGNAPDTDNLAHIRFTSLLRENLKLRSA